ncbi:penicillin-binding protein 2 [Deinococcus soli (ex Cha et al. 2016)]|uniref:Cell division protein FtsI (Penicillin-binding protein 3) n=1 Tax=Deinococcus soli (ex Cha et al. 2016) TaxID=1309411 RepID=A0ACC6KGG1_9DEIO|nr:penicillin-binding protein 2 [Deinococcus soli (ex Cha et al. 2016)]MDR6751653.1 cell division protein FtsI (penicillin-binding protein 3) [Deinococcus soli (ex Cha et al. 2016)]
MEVKIRRRSRVVLASSLSALSLLVYAYAQMQMRLPKVNVAVEASERGAIYAGDGSVLAQTLDGKRTYPQGQLAGQLLGMMGTDKGLEGIEQTYNATLASGEDVELTIDPTMQATAEAMLAKYVPEHQAEFGSVVAIETKTGRVLVSATYPPFEPGRWREFPSEVRRNRPFTDLFEPGSTVKALTVAAALNDHLITPDTTYSTPMTRPVPYQVGKRVAYKIIHDAVEHPGVLDTRHVLRYSSNVGMSHIVERFPKQAMFNYFQGYGFGQEVPLPDVFAQTGFMRNWKAWDALVQTNISFGQGVSCTPLQLALAYNVLANDGEYLPPRLIAGRSGPRPHRVLAKSTARVTREMLQAVIEEGIPRAAGIQGYKMGGKTGTAQAVVDGRYSHELYDSVFAGFFPADAPKVTMVVMVHGAKTKYHGSQLAAPIYRDVAAEAISRWALPPAPEPDTTR